MTTTGLELKQIQRFKPQRGCNIARNASFDVLIHGAVYRTNLQRPGKQFAVDDDSLIPGEFATICRGANGQSAAAESRPGFHG